jgi:intraflagellar transport protein 172
MVFRRTVWKNKFEMVYVAPSQVLVRPLHGDQPRGVILRSKYGHEISEVRLKFNIYLCSKISVLGANRWSE